MASFGQQPPGFVEVHQSLSQTNCTTTGVVVSPNDFVLLTGYFSGRLVLGEQQVSDAVDKASQVFVAKFGDGGQLAWLATAGGSSVDHANAIGVDEAGNVVIAGYFSGSAQFGGETGQTLTSLAPKDMFIARYGINGSFQWARSAGMANGGEAIALGAVMDTFGNSYVTGHFLGSGFGGMSSSFFDIFLAKYNGAGDLLWVKRAGGADADEGAAVSLDGSGNVVITGRIGGDGIVTFMDTTPVELQGGGGDDIFVAKYDPAGNLIWAKNSGSVGNEQANGIDIGSDDSIYLTGEFSDSFQFGGATLAANGGKDIFVVRYSGSGSEISGSGMNKGGNEDDSGHAITVDSTGNFTIFGGFKGEVDFGDGALASKGGSDMFAASYSAAGNLLFGLSGGGEGDDAALGGVVLGVDLLAVGTFSGVAAFGNHTVATVSQNVDSFVAVISDRPADSVQGVPGDYTGDGRLYLDDALGIMRVMSNVLP